MYFGKGRVKAFSCLNIPHVLLLFVHIRQTTMTLVCGQMNISFQVNQNTAALWDCLMSSQRVLAGSSCVFGAELCCKVHWFNIIFMVLDFDCEVMRAWQRPQIDDEGLMKENQLQLLSVFPLQVKVERLCDQMWIWIHLVSIFFFLPHSWIKIYHVISF